MESVLTKVRSLFKKGNSQDRPENATENKVASDKNLIDTNNDSKSTINKSIGDTLSKLNDSLYSEKRMENRKLNMMNSNLYMAPDLVLLNIVNFLNISDHLNFSKSCHRFNIVCQMSVLKIKGEDFEEDGPRSDKSFQPNLYFDGPKLHREVSGMQIALRWKDQGWGNRKGEVFLQLIRNKVMIAECRQPLGIADHILKKAECDLSNSDVIQKAKPGDQFRFMKNVGGGGGHSLTVKDFAVLVKWKN